MSEEHVYAYEAGYRDGSINYELEHCPACKNVADLQEVLEENAKLRESVKRLMTQRDERLARAEADNAKLRELLSVMAYCNQFRRDCDGCSMNGAAGIITERAGCDELLVRLRELGVEVEA